MRLIEFLPRSIQCGLEHNLLCAEATFNLTKEDSGFVKDGLVLSNLPHDQISYFEARRSIKFLS